MYELLLQADKALADGSLDQAERTYWQLIELDPSNAIAVAGLARVALARGDERLARRLADRAMALDPESVAAKRIVDSVEHMEADPVETELPDLLPMAAERLEALGRRRGPTSREPADGSAPPEDAAADASKTKPAGASQASAPPATRHNATRHETHRALTAGVRRFGADELRAPTQNAYAAAESAAAVEAVDALDVVEESPPAVSRPISGEDGGTSASDPTSAGESVSRRIAHVVEATDLDATQLEEAESIEAEAEAADAQESVALRAALVADSAEKEVSDLEAAWVEDGNARWTHEVAEADAAVESVAAEPTAAEPTAAEADAAEAEAALIAPRELLRAESAEPDGRVERETLPPPPVGDTDGTSERDAEVEALREALAIVLGNEGQAGPDEPGNAAAGAPASKSAERLVESAAEVEPSEPPEGATPEPATPEAEPPARRKKGLFHRFGGR